MATVQDILQNKGSQVHTIDPNATVFAAAELMNQHKIGCLLVCEEGRLVGIFTERDILQRVVGERRDPDQTKVSEVMTDEVACCRPHTGMEEARGVMQHRRIRHLPVLCDEDKIQGMISIGDLNAHQNNTQEMTISLLEQYIYGQA